MEEEQKNRLIPITKWNNHHSWPPIGGLRHLIYEREENGFEKVLKRPNRVWLIDEKAFFKWVEDRKFKFKTNKKNEACVNSD
jgi:hypothetical protein